MIEARISVALRAGVIISAAIIFAGVARLVFTGNTGYATLTPHSLPALLAFHEAVGPGYFPTSAGALLSGVRFGRPFAIIEFGILILIATPVVRVALSALYFLSARDWLYFGITVTVLAVLLGSTFASIR